MSFVTKAGLPSRANKTTCYASDGERGGATVVKYRNTFIKIKKIIINAGSICSKSHIRTHEITPVDIYICAWSHLFHFHCSFIETIIDIILLRGRGKKPEEH